MTKLVVMIEDLGHCGRVPESDMAYYEAKRYRRWDGPGPGPGQETIYQIPGIQAYLDSVKAASVKPGAVKPVIVGKPEQAEPVVTKPEPAVPVVTKPPAPPTPPLPPSVSDKGKGKD